MSDDLEISGGGSIAVATDELTACAERLGVLARDASALASRIGELLYRTAWPSAGRDETVVGHARVEDLSGRAERLARALVESAEQYGHAEYVVTALAQRAVGGLAYELGRAIPRFLLSTIAGTAILGMLGGLAAGIRGAGGLVRERGEGAGSDGLPTAPRLLREHNEAVSNPVTGALARAVAQASSDLVIGLSGLPHEMVDLLGTQALPVAASAIMAGGGIYGMMRETPVRLTAIDGRAVAGPPVGYADRLARVPDTDETDGAQVVIEKYEIAGEADRFEVYVAGTVTFSPVAAHEPWDMTSNLENAAGDDGGSFAAVAEAMRLAGVDENSPVQFTGYSQGGGTAARLAASGDYNTLGLVTFGGPTGQVPIPDEFPAVLVEHRDDIVPSLGGQQENSAALLVRRDVFGGEEVSSRYAVPAHHYEYYEQTAKLMDAAMSDRIAAPLIALDGFGAGADSVTSTAYRFERVTAPSGDR